MLLPLLSIPDLEVHALQKEIPADQRDWLAKHGLLIDHSAELQDYADTAALISLLDLVVTIDTSVAHLAGALAAPVWIMLQHNADWRWLVDRSDSPWYPTARLFRQRQAGNWAHVVAEVTSALRCWAGQR
jgi:ADP-heptose:LPS heptosyltransferase